MLSFLSLPSVSLPLPSLPANIERRLVSYLLKSTLGRFVTQDSFSDQQIDSQISSGSIEIASLSFRDDVLNQYLAGSPCKFRNGKVGKVVAKLPFPNIFSAPFSLEISDLHLQLVLTDEYDDAAPPVADLSQSVSQVAESFVHEQLSNEEESELEDILSLPGAFDSNPSTPQPTKESEEPAEVKEVSFISSLIESLVSRFTLVVKSTTVNLQLSDRAEIELIIPEIACSTQAENNVATRIATITGMHVNWIDIGSSPTESATPTSSMDEETTMMMSQSIACLPESEMAESMYFSVASLPPTEGRRATRHEQLILSLQSRPIIIQLNAALYGNSATTPKVSVIVGILGVALCPGHIAALSEAQSSISVRRKGSASTTLEGHTSSSPPNLQFTLEFQGIDALLVPGTAHGQWGDIITPFLTKPSLPVPQISHIYAQVRTIAAHYGRSNMREDEEEPERTPGPQLALDIGEWSLTLGSETAPGSWRTFPVILSDPLLTQHKGHSDSRTALEQLRGLSTFKPSSWRTRPHPQRHEEDAASPPFALSIKSELGATTVVEIAPLKIFLDLEHQSQLLRYVEEFRLYHPLSPPREATPPLLDKRKHTRVMFNDEDSTMHPPPESAIPEETHQKAAASIKIRLPLVRALLRVPRAKSSRDRTTNRSGPVLLELSGIKCHAITDSTNPEYALSWQTTALFVSRTEGPTFYEVLSLRKTSSNREHPTVRYSPTTNSADSRNACTVSLPTVKMGVGRDGINALQYFVDDLSKFFADESPPISSLSSSTSAQSSTQSSNLLGSRYFADSRQASIWGGHRDVEPDSTVQLFIEHVRLELVAASSKLLRLDVKAVEAQLDTKSGAYTTIKSKVGFLNLIIRHGEEKSDFVLLRPIHRHLESSTMLAMDFSSYTVPSTLLKESSIRVTLAQTVLEPITDQAAILEWIALIKPPPDTFDTVPPAEKTKLTVSLNEVYLQLRQPSRQGSLCVFLQGPKAEIVLYGEEVSLRASIDYAAILFGMEISLAEIEALLGVDALVSAGYAMLAEASNLEAGVEKRSTSRLDVTISRAGVTVHLCADTIGPIQQFFEPDPAKPKPKKRRIAPDTSSGQSAKVEENLLASIDDHTFRGMPTMPTESDLINDDLPTNRDFIDASLGPVAAFRELSDNESDPSDSVEFGAAKGRILHPMGIQIIEDYFRSLPPEDISGDSSSSDASINVSVRSTNVSLKMYEGYDWRRTHRVIEEQRKAIRKRLAKLKQVLSSGQTMDMTMDTDPFEGTSALLFNSVHLGLANNGYDDLDDEALLDAIDRELGGEEKELDASWETIRPAPSTSGQSHPSTSNAPSLRRKRNPSVEIVLSNVEATFNQFEPGSELASRVLVTARELEILDHMKSSTWQRFLTSMRTDSLGNLRESDSNMVRVELKTLKVSPTSGMEELRLRAKILPLRLHVDQDALDFFKAFAAFQTPEQMEKNKTQQAEPAGDEEPFFQQAEIFPIQIKLDYKPKRVDYAALKEGKTIEMMNFFHFEGSEMTLRHLVLSGISGWPRLFDLLNDLWTPDVKANQLADVIAGIAPIRSVVNVGTGVADLVLLPIAAFQKDRRVFKGAKRGANSFMKSTALETIKLGARLATGTQVILERAESVLGGQFENSITTETMSDPALGGPLSRFAEQPEDVREGLKHAYKSMSRNLNLAGQTILALPMEVHERSGTEGAMRTVVRAVPIAILKPMIGASEAVSKTLLGLRNSMAPEKREDDESKYKRRL